MNLTRQPVARIHQHIGHWIWWRIKPGRDGWGKLTRAAGRNLWYRDQFGAEESLYLPHITFLGVATSRTISPTWLDLREGSIIGIVDSRDAVDSRFIAADRLSTAETHSAFWPAQAHGRWRWTFDKGPMAFVPESAPVGCQWEAVRRHITKRYGIEWWDNGYHDLHHLLAHVHSEREAKAARPPQTGPAVCT